MNKLTKSIMIALATAAVYVGGYFTNVQSGDHPVHNAIARGLFVADREAIRILRLGGFACGVEKWATKTLSDPQASLVNFTPVATNIPKLRSVPPPVNVDDPRNTPDHAKVELQTFLLSGSRLVAYKEEPDSDIHLELQSTIDKSTMIVEIPDPNCVSSSFKRAEIAQARLDFTTEIGQPTGSYQFLNVPVRITGVGFFDFLHGQKGVAPNGIELHPVLSFKKL